MSFGHPSLQRAGQSGSFHGHGNQRPSSTSTTLVLSPGQNQVLRLRPPEGAQAQSLPRALSTRKIAGPPSREALLSETQAMKIRRHLIADKLAKLDPDIPSQERASLETQRQQLDDRIERRVEAYKENYGVEMLGMLMKWRDTANDLLLKGNAASSQHLADIQQQLEKFVPELEAFFHKETQKMHSTLFNQLTDARGPSLTRENRDRLMALLDSDRPIIPNQLRAGDDLILYALYRHLDVELDNLISILALDDVDDQELVRTRESISVTTDKLDKIRHLFETVIPRYDRLTSDQQYPHQLSRIKQAVRKGQIALDPSLADQNRQRMIDRLEDHAANRDHLLTMSEEDFQLVYTLLSKKPLTEAHKDTLQKNQWQLSDRERLVTQGGHPLVRVISSGSNFTLVDSASGARIGSLDRVRWDRIQAKLAEKGLTGADNISRQMIIEDFREFPTGEQPHEARFDDFHGTLRLRRDYGGPGDPRCRPPSSEPALSEPLRGLRHFHP